MKVKFSRNLAFILWRLHSLMFFFSFSAWPPLTYFKIDWAVIVFEHDFSFGIFKLGYTKKRPGFWRFWYFKIDWAVIVFGHDFSFGIFHLGSTKKIIFCRKIKRTFSSTDKIISEHIFCVLSLAQKIKVSLKAKLSVVIGQFWKSLKKDLNMTLILEFSN